MQYVASETPPSGKYELLTQEEYEAALEKLSDEQGSYLSNSMKE